MAEKPNSNDDFDQRKTEAGIMIADLMFDLGADPVIEACQEIVDREDGASTRKEIRNQFDEPED